MNIFNKVTLQSLKKSRTRTIVTIIGVVFSAAMFTAVVTFGVSLLNYMKNGAMQKYGNWHVAFLDVDLAFTEEQTGNSKVSDTVSFQNIGYAMLDGASTPDRPYLFIAGFDRDTFNALPVTLLSGRLPENSEEILISGSVATKGGVTFALGDTLSLAVGTRMSGSEELGQSASYLSDSETLVTRDERTYTVVGICQTPSFEKASAPGYTLITTSDVTDSADHFSLFVTLKNPNKVHSYTDSVSGNHNYIFNNNVLRFMGLSDDSGDKLITALLYTVGTIVIVIIMIGSIFLIYNSFHISLNERTQQFGILASVGATAKQLQNSVIFEGFCIGVVGIPIGIIVGIGSITIVISVVASNFRNLLYTNVPLTLHVSAFAIIGAAAVSIVTILISAYIPARNAANTPIMECIRQTNEVKVESGALKTSNVSQRIYGLEGTLALKNFKRNKKRYRSIVLSLILSIVLFVSTSAFVTDLKQTADQLKAVTDYDIGFGTKDLDNREMLSLYDKLKTVSGVYDSSYQFVLEYFCTIQADNLSDVCWESIQERTQETVVQLPAEIQVLDDNTYLKIISNLGFPAEEFMGQNAKIIAVAKVNDNSSQVHDVSQLSDMFTSTSIDAVLIPKTNGSPNTAKTQRSNITCVEIVPPDMPPTTGTYEQTPYAFYILLPYSLMDRIAPAGTSANSRVKGLTFQSKNPSQSLAEMKAIIQNTGITSSYLIFSSSEIFEESRNYIFIANVFAYTFIIMISLIALANVFNTISTNIKLRRRELAMLRSVGMSERDFNKMMRFECAFYGIRALFFGLPIAVTSSWLIYKGMFVAGADNINFTLPWMSIGISIFSVLLVIFVTMMYAVGKIKKENIIDALREDME